MDNVVSSWSSQKTEILPVTPFEHITLCVSAVCCHRLENCTNAMNVARDKLNIPMVVHPEDLASPHLDDLSGMTYLSYYMMPDSPGYFATRREIRKILQSGTIDNFTVRCIFFFSSAAHLLLAFRVFSGFA